VTRRSAEVEIEVPFHDVDMVGIVWHGHYAKYFEIARCALLESFRYNYMEMMASGYGWPVIDLRLRYVKPAQFGQKIRVRATLLEWENRLRIEYLVRDAVSGERLTKGETVQVAVHIATREMCLQSPDVLFERLGVPKP
jgi:acyl-CoA thioester hydrolase